MTRFFKRLTFRYFLTVVMLSFSWTLYAQQVSTTAKGNVTDQMGEPLVGVSVVLTQNTSKGTVTNVNGEFTLEGVKIGESLQFRFLGMKTQEVIFKGDPLRVILEEDAKMMEEVIVVAYGEQKRSAFTGSAAVVTSDVIARRPVSNVMNTLEGVSSGVQIQKTSGSPDSSPSFRIRGVGSINAGSSPLVVVDGVPYESGLNNVNPSDVESVTVLKDAASAAIYGARGGNGVILVTTKKATKQDKISVTLDAKFAMTQVRASDLYDVIKEPGEYYERHYQAMYNYYQNVAGYNSFMANREANASWLRNSDQGGLGYFVYTIPEGQQLIGYNGKLNPNATLGRIIANANGESYFLTPDDWVDETYKTGFRQDYNLNIKGGSGKLNMLASAGYTKETGIAEPSSYERFTGRIKGVFNANKWLRINGNLDTSVSQTNSNSDYNDNSNNIFSNANRVAPIYPIFIRDTNGNILQDENGKVYDYGDGTHNNGISRPINTGSNRLQEALLETDRVESVKLGAQGAADFIITPSLTATLNVSYEHRDRKIKSTRQPFYGSSNPGGNVYVYDYKNQSLNLQQLVNYNERFGDHSVKVTLLHEFYKWDYDYLYGSKSNMFSYLENQELAGAITLLGANSYTRGYQSEGYGGRVLYDYKDKYNFDVSYRRDASSNFHPDHRWGNFYSFGGAYLISREDFFRVPWLDELKFKLSFGQNGNDGIGRHNYIDTYNIGNANGEIALTFKNRGNKNITWETRTAINAGVEFELFKGRLRGSVDYYNNKTTDMLAAVSVPYSLGYSSYWANVGSMRNSGVEIELHGDIIRTKDFRWSMYVNASLNKAKVLKLAPERTGETLYDINGNTVAKGYSSGGYFFGEGLEYKTWRLRKFAGIDDTGKSMWYTHDEETGEISTTTTYSSASYFDCGSSQPKVLGGFGGGFSWKSLELFFSFAYRLGGKAYDSGYSSLMTGPYNGRTGYNYHKDTEKSWTPQNMSNEFARWQYDDRYFTSSSDRWLAKADYLSLQNITLSYVLPRQLVRNIGIEGMTASVGVDNVFFISHRKGFVPSRDFDGNLDFGYYPEVRRFMFNLNFQF